MKGNQLINSIPQCSFCPLTSNPNNIMCSLCKIIRHPHPLLLLKTMNYFHIFNMKPKYSIDQSRLRQFYKEIQKQIHPDKHLVKGHLIQSEANDCSSFVTEAYQTIKGDMTRAQYLLQLFGIANKKTSVNSLFLSNIYLLREEIEISKSKQRLYDLHSSIQDQINKSMLHLNSLFEKKQYEKIQKILQKIQYNQTLFNAISQKINYL